MPAVKPTWFSKERSKKWIRIETFGRLAEWPNADAWNSMWSPTGWDTAGSNPAPSTILRSLTYWNRRKYPPQSGISLKRLTIGDSGPTTLGWFCQGESSGKVWTNFFISSHQPNSAAIRLGGADGLVYILGSHDADGLTPDLDRVCAGSIPAMATLTPKIKNYGTGSFESWAQEHAHADRIWCRHLRWYVYIRLRRPSVGEVINPWVLSYEMPETTF